MFDVDLDGRLATTFCSEDVVLSPHRAVRIWLAARAIARVSSPLPDVENRLKWLFRFEKSTDHMRPVDLARINM